MIRGMAKYFIGISPVFVDGFLYMLVAWFTFNQSYLGGDEAAKWIAPNVKFWINWAIGSGATCCAAIKMFRSSAYADHQQRKELQGKDTGP